MEPDTVLNILDMMSYLNILSESRQAHWNSKMTDTASFLLESYTINDTAHLMGRTPASIRYFKYQILPAINFQPKSHYMPIGRIKDLLRLKNKGLEKLIAGLNREPVRIKRCLTALGFEFTDLKNDPQGK